MTVPTGSGDAAPTQLSPALSALLGEAALIHRLDSQSADEVAQTGVLKVNGTVVVAMSIPPAGSRGIAYNDVALVCPITYIKTPTAAQMAFLLEANFPLMTTMGCSVSRTKEGALQVLHGARLADLDARRLAEKQWSVLATALSMRQQLDELGKTAQQPARPGAKAVQRPAAPHAVKTAQSPRTGA